MTCSLLYFIFFFFNDTATTEIYTLSLHDALPISAATYHTAQTRGTWSDGVNLVTSDAHAGLKAAIGAVGRVRSQRSEEHTSELQSLAYLVCRLLLEKKKNIN